MRNLSNVSIAAAAVLTAGILSACGSGTPASPPANTSAAAPSEPIAIDVTKVTQQQLDVPLTIPGELRPYQTVDVHARVTGFVRSIPVDRGSHVRAGALLAVVEAPELTAQRAQAQSALQASEARLQAARSKADADRNTFDRLKAASATPGVVAGNDVSLAEKSADSSRNEMIAAERGVDAARQALAAHAEMEGYLRITAPFDGIVTARNVHPGALVGPNAGAAAPMLTLSQTRRLRLVVPLPEAYTGHITPNTGVTFTVAAYPGRTWTATVARMAESVDAATRTMAVELDVDNGDGKLAAGTFCQVRWPVKREAPSLFVPTGSVASTTGRTFVIRIRDGKTEWVDVKTGMTAAKLIEVFGNLAAGDVIAMRGTDELAAGTPVRAK